MVTYIALITLLLHTAPDTSAPNPELDLDRIKLMVVNGEVREAIDSLEQTFRSDQPTEEAAALLIQLYQQSFQYRELKDTYENYRDLLEDHSEATLSFAQAKLQTGYRRDASHMLETLRGSDSGDPRIRILLGRIYFEDEEWEKAKPVYSELTDLVPDNLFFTTRKARVYRNLMEEERAREILREVLEEDPEFLPAILELVSIHYVNNDLQEARTLADRGLELYPEESRLWDLSARTAYHQRDYEKAIDHWMRVILLEDATFSIYRSLGLCYYQLGDTDNALGHFRQALGENPDDTITLFYTAMTYRQLEEWGRMKETLDHLFTIHIGDYLMDTVMQRAVASESLGNMGDAESDYLLATLLDPDHHDADFYLATLYDRHFEDRNAALRQYEKYLENAGELDPAKAETARSRMRTLREQIHFQQGR